MTNAMTQEELDDLLGPDDESDDPAADQGFMTDAQAAPKTKAEFDDLLFQAIETCQRSRYKAPAPSHAAFWPDF